MQIPGIGKISSITSIFIALISMIYIICPIDLIPDFIPIIGWVDDFIALIIAGFAFIAGFVER